VVLPNLCGALWPKIEIRKIAGLQYSEKIENDLKSFS
jgi:hypothetical protein